MHPSVLCTSAHGIYSRLIHTMRCTSSILSDKAQREQNASLQEILPILIAKYTILFVCVCYIKQYSCSRVCAYYDLSYYRIPYLPLQTDLTKQGRLKSVATKPGFWYGCTPLRKHAYSNILEILPPKMKIFQIKNCDIFYISAQNIVCWYSLEPPRQGGSNEYP